MVSDDRTIVAFRPRVSRGTRLNGIYEIEDLIATGGMGEVYKGHAIQTGDAVAIKMIRPELAENEAALALFRKEAAALHNLYHEAVVRYYVFSIDPLLRSPYLAMEFVDGLALSDVIKRGPLGFQDVDLLRRRVAGALHAAHEAGIIHRDISPDNIILPAGNIARAKIIDFGIARSTKLGDGTVIGGGFAGKHNYVSPEQLGLYGGEVTGKSDIYSLGLVLAEALGGRPLDMGGTQIQIVEKRRRVPDLASIDARLRPLIARMLEPRPADRPGSMAEIAAWSPPAAKARRKAPLVALAGAAGLAILGGGAYLLAPGLLAGIFPGGIFSGGIFSGGTSSGGTPGKGTPSPPPGGEAPSLNPGPASQGGSAGPVAPGPGPAPNPNPSASTGASSSPAPSPSPGPSPNTATTKADPPPVLVPPPAPPVTPAPQPAPSPAAAHNTAPAPVPYPAPAPAPVPAPGPVAALPPALGVVERITRYVANYDGGPCVYLTPTAITEKKAAVEGFGTQPAPFTAFEKAFQKANGFEPDISLRQVTQAQCAMVGFLSQARGLLDNSLKLQINSFNLRSGETLSGSVEGQGERHVTVLLIADDGFVYDLAGYLSRDADRLNFGLKVQIAGGPQAKPTLVMAIASPRPLAGLPGNRPVAAEELFPRLASEAQRNGEPIGVAVKYFRVVG